jgi:hypothetical protein
MRLYLPAVFENRRGTLYPDNGKVEFCGLIFDNSCQAISLLKLITGEKIVGTFYYKGFRGYEIDNGRIVCIGPSNLLLEYGSNFTARKSIDVLKKKCLL